MTEPFATLIPDAQAYFTELAASNTKDWFDANKARYADRVRKPAEALADVMAGEFGRLTGRALTAKVYRINRDIRFSRDKSPYNTHLHMLWSSGAEDRPGLFFAVNPTGVSLSAGVMGFTPGGLEWARQAIADDPQPWLLAWSQVRAAGGDLADWGEPPLKRVPKPFDPAHPGAELLRRKSLILTLPLDPAAVSAGLVPGLRQAAEQLLPFWACFDAGVQT